MATLPLDSEVKELRPVDPVSLPAPVDVAAMFERLARDPSVDVEKLERLIAMQERIMRHNAKAESDSAFSVMQGELPVITEKGQIVVGGTLRSKYATNEDIQETVKPILQRHGFAIRFRNEVADDGKLKVIGILSHRSGHSEHDEFVTRPDDSGSKNAIQAIGSARSYGQRYTTTALLNIATRGEDDNGIASEAPAAPNGYDDWLVTFSEAANGGMPALRAAFKAGTPAHRNHLTRYDVTNYELIKARAQKVAV